MKKLLILLAFTMSMTMAFAGVHPWGDVSRLTVEGNHLVDPEGNQVVLHGVMDTPSPYFSGYRFSDGNWINVYTQGDNYITKCINYFNSLFTAVTDTKQGSWCNVFRLHLDPCWTDNPNKKATGFTEKNGKIYDPNGTEVSGEANIRNFDKTRLSTYLTKLFIKIAEKAKGHGMYVILRPPGVCPSTIKVGDYYQQYLMTVWDVVSKNATIKKYSDWISIELANEPIAVCDANGNRNNNAKHDFFQPIVDKIRENGFDGIIWVPGETWQQDYKSYAKKPITDPMYPEKPQIGYAVHWYPGWFSASDSQTNKTNSLNSFLDMVPVAKTNPIMITEVDWSPKDPNGKGHYNESGQWVEPNCGTWATGTTSKFGQVFKYVVDYLGNVGWTLTHTHDYLDIDYYLGLSPTEPHKPLANPVGKGTVRPAFYTKLSGNTYEACSGACFKWYPEYAQTEFKAREWEIIKGDEIEPQQESVDEAASLNGKILFATDIDCERIWYGSSDAESPQNTNVGNYDKIADNQYCWLKFNKISNPGCKTTGNLYTIQLVNQTGNPYSVWGNAGYLNTPPGTWCLFTLGLGNKYGVDKDYYGLWQVTYEAGSGYVIRNVGAMENNENSYVTPSQGTPQASKCYTRLFGKLGKKTPTGIEHTIAAPRTDGFIYDLMGRRVQNPVSGRLYIRNGKKFIMK